MARPNKEDFDRAVQLGIEACLAGKKCVPFMDEGLVDILAECEVGQGYKVTHAWLDAWTRCNVQLGQGTRVEGEQRVVAGEFIDRIHKTLEPFENAGLKVVLGWPEASPEDEVWPIALVINDKTKEVRIDEVGERLYAECVRFARSKVEERKGDPARDDITLHCSEGYYNIIS